VRFGEVGARAVSPHDLCNAEVEQFDDPIRRNFDVRRFEITMGYARSWAASRASAI
jgi:hypothetical protein